MKIPTHFYCDRYSTIQEIHSNHMNLVKPDTIKECFEPDRLQFLLEKLHARYCDEDSCKELKTRITKFNYIEVIYLINNILVDKKG